MHMDFLEPYKQDFSMLFSTKADYSEKTNTKRTTFGELETFGIYLRVEYMHTTMI